VRRSWSLTPATLTSLALRLRMPRGVFVMIPGNFAPAKDFPETRAIVAALGSALAKARPLKAVYLSSVGAHQTKGPGLITQLHILEQELGGLPIPGAFLRPAWFMENSQWDLAAARETGEVPAFLQPVSRRISMVATDDIGRTAASVLQQTWTGNRFIEIEGPQRYSPSDIAEALASLLGRSVRAVAVPRAQWGSAVREPGGRSGRSESRCWTGSTPAGSILSRMELSTSWVSVR